MEIIPAGLQENTNFITMKIKYRPEIDGLRFLAVTAVILYHADLSFLDLNFFAGGFLGVDIFFVISGYLIGKLIYNQTRSGNFSVISFIVRRLRRIYPALFVMCFVVSIFGFVYLFPTSVTELINSVVSSLFFFSNYHFYISGHEYGANTLLVKPLIHTWSLSVELQFYIIVSIIAYFFIKKNLKLNFDLIFILILISFFLSNFFAVFERNLNFYLIFSRLWELLIGFYLVKFENKKYLKPYTQRFLILLSLFILISSFVFFSEETAHPSFKTLPVVAATSIFILFIEKNKLLHHFFSNKIMVWPGLMSYSLYVWHYPIFIFVKYLNLTQANNLNKFLVIVMVFFISFLSYRFVEKPFRESREYLYKYFNYFSFTSLFLVTLFFLIFINSDKSFSNFQKVNKNVKLNESFIWDNKFYLDQFKKELSNHGDYKYFNNNQKKVLIIGNSYGADFYLIFKRNLKLFKEYDFSFINTQFYCLENLFLNNKVCNDNNLINLENKIENSDIIIISTRWNKKDFKNFNKTIEWLKSYNKKIILVPRYEFLVEDQFTIIDIFTMQNKKIPNLEEKIIVGNEYFSKRTFNSRKIKSFLIKYSDENQLEILDFSKIQCNHISKFCDPIISIKNTKIYYDRGHLTLDGIDFFSKKIRKKFNY